MLHITCNMRTRDLPDMYALRHTYCIAGFFKGENFHESIAIRENFTLEIFTKSIRHCVLLTRFVKTVPLEKLD